MDFYNVLQEVINSLSLALRIEVPIDIYYVALEVNQMNKVIYKKREGHTQNQEDTDI